MAAEQNLIDVKALGTAKSIDLANKIGRELTGLFEVLGVTSKLPMNVGAAIKTYAYKIVESEKPNGDVPEGDVIPLTKVERVPVDITELTFTKYRKSTSAEAIQAHGYDIAIQDTDEVVLDHVQSKFRGKFFTALEMAVGSEKRTNLAGSTIEGYGLQSVLAKGRANLRTVTKRNVDAIAFVNPMDVAEYISKGLIVSSGSSFGLTLLTDYVGVKVIEADEVPSGYIYMTHSKNIKVAYANPKGELSKAFPLVSDETGFVGILHDIQAERLTADTVYLSAVEMYPENIDEVIFAQIKNPAPVA